MNVLIVGSGGREHALAYKISQSEKVDKIFCIPGNAGISSLVTACFDYDVSDVKSLVNFAKSELIDLTVVGPEVPLVNGIVDEFEKEGLRVFGPNKKAAQMEGSKIFAKRLLEKYNIPTAKSFVFDDYDKALDYINKNTPPFVIKADGLAAGKGVMIASDKNTAEESVKDCFIKRKFKEAGKKVLIEEFLSGDEVSILSFVDGETILPMTPAQDYKKVFDGDKGLNTGGMGAYSPVPIVTDEVYETITSQILLPTLDALKNEGIIYKGVLYAGLIFTSDGPKVLEFNVRFGDPETQAILPRLKNDLVDLIDAVVDGNLSDKKLEWRKEKCVSVVLASGGYPEDYSTGYEIKGLEKLEKMDGISVFHAGTSFKDGKVVTAGGRVLNISALGSSFEEARKKAYAAINEIYFENMHYRKDIAKT
ncbi:MAG: phosphoribosylamine--glycine ligase [Actinobacteria bacterium]|nr:phosphoribosylamine--glycine ligase [Actinomycetota bacterium]